MRVSPRLLFDQTRRLSQVRQAIHHRNAEINAFNSISKQTPSCSSGSLNGVSVAVKDNICTKDLPTTCSSRVLQDYTPPFDATVVDILRDAGADIVGKTNCDEFGMGSMNIYSTFGPVVNPFSSPLASEGSGMSAKRSAGGSSGGSAAAVAADLSTIALGTDTGGSIRLPASYCGVAGFKPSYGLLSRWGVISYADSLDCVGILSKTVGKVSDTFKLLNVYDSKDPTAASLDIRNEANGHAPKHSLSDQPPLDGLRIGIPQEYFPLECSPAMLHSVQMVVNSLERHGASFVPVSLPTTRYALSAYYVIASAEATSNLARYDGVQYGARIPATDTASKPSAVYAGTRSASFGPEVRRRLLLGTYSLTAGAFDNYFLQAMRVRKMIRNDFDRVFRMPNVLTNSTPESQAVDVLLHPSAIDTAPLLDEDQSSLDSYVQDVMTVPASLAGLPALSVPLKDSAIEWPMGISVVGQWGNDDLVLKVGQIIESL